MTTQEWLNRREHGAGIVELQLGHGPSNALTAPFLDGIAQSIRDLDTSAETKVIMISSPFTAFSTGTDGRPDVETFNQALDNALISLFSCKTPTLAVINGDIHGPGLSLALTCDTRVGVTKSGYSFKAIETGLGLSAAETVLLTSMLDPNVARRLLLTSQTIGPVAARNYGMIDIVAEDQEDLWMYALREAKALSALSPEAYARIKSTLRAATLGAMRDAAT